MPATTYPVSPELLERIEAALLRIEARENKDHLGLNSAAARLDCSVSYLRRHLDMFPNAWRADGGEIKIPASDIERVAKERRLRKKILTE